MSDNKPQLAEAIAAHFEHFLEELRAELATSTDTIRDTGARAVAVTDKRPATSPGAVVGWALRETTGAATATIVLRDGADANGAALFEITLAANESVRDWFGPGGVGFGRGLYVDVTSGAVRGTVFLRAVE